MAEPVIGVLLAGGHGRRAGGPKALKVVGGRPLWRAQAGAMVSDLGCVVAVLHPGAWPDADAPLLGCIPVASDPDATQLASLQRGLAEVATGAALVLPIDCPWPGTAVVAALATAAEATGVLAAVPTVTLDGQVRRGHPVWLAAAAVGQLLTLDPQLNRLDHWLAGMPERVALVDVGDPAILANFNRDAIAG